MSQNREPPAFQEFAAAMLAQIPFRVMLLGPRGLLYSMRLECWVNKRLPRDPAQLAKVLGQPLAEVSEFLPSVMPFFAIDGEFIYSPELENYRGHLAEIRGKQSQGGKNSSEAKKGKRKTSATRMDKGASSTLASDLQVSTQVGCKSLVQPNTTQPNTTPSLGVGVIDQASVDDWNADYESAESASAAAYLKATRG